MKIREKIKSYLCETGRTQAYLSRKTGIPPARLSLIFNGKRTLKLEEYVAICKVLELPASAFLSTDMSDDDEN